MKTCRKCGETKSLDQYNVDRSRPDGKSNYCRSCVHVFNRAQQTKLVVSPLTGQRIKASAARWHKLVPDPVTGKLIKWSTLNNRQRRATAEGKAYHRRTHNKFLQTPENWARVLLHKVRVRGFACDLSVEWLEDLWQKQGGRCVLSGIELQKTYGGEPRQVSLDRIDNARGYLRNNVRLVLAAVNLARSIYKTSDVQAAVRSIDFSFEPDFERGEQLVLSEKKFQHRLASQARRSTRYRNAKGRMHKQVSIDPRWLENQLRYGICSVTGLKLLDANDHPLTPSLDRRDCSKGYSSGNSRIVAQFVNFGMHTWGDVVFLEILKAWQSYLVRLLGHNQLDC